MTWIWKKKPKISHFKIGDKVRYINKKGLTGFYNQTGVIQKIYIELASYPIMVRFSNESSYVPCKENELELIS